MIWQKMHAGMIIRVGKLGSIKSLINQSELSCAILHCLTSSPYEYWIFVSIVSFTKGCLNAYVRYKPRRVSTYTDNILDIAPIPTIALKLDSGLIRKWDSKTEAIKTYLTGIVKLKYMIRKIANTIPINITMLISS